MTASVFASARPADERRPFPFVPAEGWVTLAAALLLVLPLAWSFGDAAWVPGRPDALDYLPWVAAAGLAWGFAGAKLRRGRWSTLITGAVIGGLLTIVVAGSFALQPDDPWAGLLDPTTLPDRLRAIGLSVDQVWVDLVIAGQPFTTEVAHYHLWFAGVTWGTALAAGYTIFGHRRPLDALVTTGLMLLVDMAATGRDQLQLLIVFTLAGLVLLVRAHAFDEQAAWVRRRIGDPAAVNSLYLRGGAVFISLAIVAALTLTATASSAPLQGFWADLPSRFAGAVGWLERWFPDTGAGRGASIVGFGSESTTRGVWSPGSGTAFRATLPANETRAYHWRVGTYAEYTRFGWKWGTTVALPHNPNALVLAGTLDDPGLLAGRRELRVRIEPDAYGATGVISPQSVERLDRASETTLTASNGRFVTVEVTDGGGPYTVTALVPITGTGPGALTEFRLRAAGTAYPADVAATYLALPADAMGTASDALLAAIVASLPASARPDGVPDPYDLARATERYLRDPAHFTYETDVTAAMRASCSGLSSVECFARIKIGYCEFYASTMAVLLRSQGIPARIAYGYLPGDRVDGVETVPASAQHWWVEVYFPGYGWVEFDPTGGDVGQPEQIAAGSAGDPTPAPIPTGGDDQAGPSPSRTTDQGGTTAGPASPGPFVAIAIVLLVGLAILALAARGRSSRRRMAADQAWGSIARWARRAGLAPGPSQTVYEYAAVLGEAVPGVRIDVATVARAKVEVAYGRRDLGEARLEAVATAYRRLRAALIRLAIRPRRRLRRR